MRPRRRTEELVRRSRILEAADAAAGRLPCLLADDVPGARAHWDPLLRAAIGKRTTRPPSDHELATMATYAERAARAGEPSDAACVAFALRNRHPSIEYREATEGDRPLVWVDGVPNPASFGMDPPVANPFSHEDRESLRLLARAGVLMGESGIVDADGKRPGRMLHLEDPERAPVEALLLAAEILGDRKEVLTVELGHSSGPAALSVFMPRTPIWTASLAVAPLLRPHREQSQGVVVNVPTPDPFDAIVINIPTAEAFTFNLWATDPEAGPRPPRIPSVPTYLRRRPPESLV